MIPFFLFGLSIALFLFLLTLIKRNKTKADYVLAAWMGFTTLHLSLFVLDYTKVSMQYPHMLGIPLAFPVLHGLFLYSFTMLTITNRSFKTGFLVLQLIPFVSLVVLAAPFYLMTGPEKVEVYAHEGRGFEWYTIIQHIVIVALGLMYSVLSIAKIRQHRRRMLEVFSNNEKKKLVWLEVASIGLACIWILAAFFADGVTFTGVVLFVLLIGLFGINQAPVFFATPAEPVAPEPAGKARDDDSTPKYQKSGLSEDDATRLLLALSAYMDSNKPFTNPNLTLDELAAQLNVNTNQLSQVINSRISKSFYHYINSYRIREFLARSASPDSRKFTYLGLASDCGFQSKTTFNKYFKMETGKTPSEYFQEVAAER